MIDSVGVALRSERERQRRSTTEIARELCITERYVRAIEQDDLAGLPGTFFYKSFAKQYAAVLHFDGASLQPAMDRLTGSLEPLPLPGADSRYQAKQAEKPPVRPLDPIVYQENRRYFQDSRMGAPLAALLAMVLVTSGVYTWYNKARQPGNAPPAKQVERPVAAPPAAPAPVAAPVKADESSASPMAGQPSAPSAETPSLDVTTTTGADGVNHVVLNLSATEKTWLSISSDGKQIFSGILEPSQTKTLTGLDVAKLKVGNAGGLEVRWNGKAIGPIGPRGQVRVVLFTPENFQILAPSQPL